MGAVQILTHSMVQSIEENSVRKGYDPRDFALVAEGGAGPLFAAQIALEVGTPWVLVPPYPGVTAAHGPARDGHGLRVRLDGLPAPLAARRRRRSSARSRSSRQQARAQLEEDGVPADRIADPARRRLPLPRPGLRAPRRRRLRRDRRRLGREGARRLPRHPRARVLAALRGLRHRDPERPRPRDRADAAARRRREVEHGDESPEAALRYERDAWFRVGGELEQVPTRYYDRAALKAGNRLEGPAIVNQYDSTTVIPPGARGARRPLREHRHRDRRRRAERGGAADAAEAASMSVDRVRGRPPAGAARRASASRSTRSRCASSAARSTRSPRRWRACSSG